MAFSSIVRALGRSPLTTELVSKLNRQHNLRLSGISRLPKGFITSALAQTDKQNLLVVCATLEEAGRAYAQLEAMGWETVHFYPTSEASPYEPFDPETEMTWGQMQVLADLVKLRKGKEGERGGEGERENFSPSPTSPLRVRQSPQRGEPAHGAGLTIPPSSRWRLWQRKERCNLIYHLHSLLNLFVSLSSGGWNLI
jgi:hypothetical protein